jgi:AcrR family transcriptional regulator
LSYRETACFIKPVNAALWQVAGALLDDHGWEALNLDRIAARAGVSRATVWRHGVTRTSVEKVLRHRLVADYRDLLWGPLTGEGTGRERLAGALGALCQVAERNLPLLAHTETAFHGPDLEAVGIELDFYGPWLRIMEAGEADGSLEPGPDRTTFIAVLTNMVLLTYVHLRAHHGQFGWEPTNTTEYVVDLVGRGYLPR